MRSSRIFTYQPPAGILAEAKLAKSEKREIEMRELYNIIEKISVESGSGK